MVETKNNPCLHGNAVRVNPRDGARVFVHMVKTLANLVDAPLANRFQTDEQLFASAARGQLQKLVILCCLNARLAAPPFPVRRERSEQVLGVGEVARQIVIPQDNHFTAK